MKMIVDVSRGEVILSEFNIAFSFRLIEKDDIAFRFKSRETANPAYILIQWVQSDYDVEVFTNSLVHIHHELVFSWLFSSPTVLYIIWIC